MGQKHFMIKGGWRFCSGEAFVWEEHWVAEDAMNVTTITTVTAAGQHVYFSFKC